MLLQLWRATAGGRRLGPGRRAAAAAASVLPRRHASSAAAAAQPDDGAVDVEGGEVLVLPPEAPRLAPCEMWIHSFLGFSTTKTGYVRLSEHVFGEPPRPDILQSVVIYQRAKKWQGTAKTKTRAEVRGGGRKPWKQKGTGNARHSSIRSPLWRGGGTVHGPVPHDHSIKLNKKIRSLGIKVALSVKYAQNDLALVDGAELTSGSKEDLMGVLREHGWQRALIVPGEEVPPNLLEAAALVPKRVKALPQRYVNVMDILKYDVLVLTPESLGYLEQRFAADETAASDSPLESRLVQFGEEDLVDVDGELDAVLRQLKGHRPGKKDDAAATAAGLE